MKVRLTPVALSAVAAVAALAWCGCDPSPSVEASDDEPDSSSAKANGSETSQKSDRPSSRPDSFADAVTDVRPAVVNLYNREKGDRSAPESNSRRALVPEDRLADSLGSGFIIDDDGHILTNHHVIKGIDKVGVRLIDESFFEAEIIGADPQTDLALLRIEEDKDELPVAEIGDSDKLRVGDWVVAVGNPLGLTSTVTAGITSAIGREGIPVDEEMRYQDFIQTDASINPGNSGGPLVDTDGAVIGINTVISADGQGIGFAIPINMATELLPQLKEKGRVERSWLGMYVGEMNDKLSDDLGGPDDLEGGALVTRIVEGGPADKADLRRGDIILAVDGEAIDSANSLAWRAASLGIGRTIEIDLWREGKRHSTELTTVEQPD
ncbi:MAG: S1C family serine protease [Persicimonas sp.]